MIMFGPITEQIDFKRSGKDDTGLGRWTVMMLQVAGIRTCVGTTHAEIASSIAGHHINNTDDSLSHSKKTSPAPGNTSGKT